MTRSGMPAPGIPSDWSDLTDYINTLAVPSLPSFLPLYFRHRVLSIQRSQLFRSLEAKPTRGSRDARALRARRDYNSLRPRPLASREQKKPNYKPKIRLFDNEKMEYATLESKEYIKYLGILIDKNLTWKHHIDTVSLKISKTVGLLAKLRHFVPRQILFKVYRSLIYLYIIYGLAAWGQAAKTHLNKILLLQKRTLRIINFPDRRDHAIPLFIDADVLPSNFSYYLTISNLMHDVHNNKVSSGILNLFQKTSSCHSYNTKASASGNFCVNSSDLELYKLSFSRFGAKLWNEIPCNIRHLPKNKFKKHSVNYFLIF